MNLVRRPASVSLRSPRRFLLAMGALIPILACGAPPYVTHQSSATLTLAITITGQYDNGSSVQIAVGFKDTSNPVEPASPPEGAHLICDGIDIKARDAFTSRPCPRQPAGGSYTIVYTDERGAMATAVVPIPAGSFGLLFPLAGSTVPIPTNGALEVRYVSPLPAADGSVSLAVERVDAQCGTPGVRGCGDVSVDFASIGGATTAGGQSSFSLTGDFSPFLPGPGAVALGLTARVTPNNGGFAAVTAAFQDNAYAPITWVR